MSKPSKEKKVEEVSNAAEKPWCQVLELSDDCLNDEIFHPLKVAFEEASSTSELPVLTAVGYFNASPNRRHHFVSFKLYFQGDKVLKLIINEPNMKAIAEDQAKIYFVESFSDKDPAALFTHKLPTLEEITHD